jgi:hypothetical protein
MASVAHWSTLGVIPAGKELRMTAPITTETGLRAERADLGSEPMLLDRLLADFDVTRIEHRVLSGGLAEAYEATRQADFLRAWRGSVAVRALFALRAAGERMAAVARCRPPVAPPDMAALRLATMPSHGDWVLLGEAPPHEIAFGAIGQFWAGETVWEQIDATAFASFDRPGFGKIACNFSLRPYGHEHTLVSYEVRTAVTDDGSRRAFLRYWRPLSPFIGVVMRSLLRVVADEASTAFSRRMPRTTTRA